MDELIQVARQAFATWGRLPLDERIAHLRQYQQRLKEEESAFITTISEETGKPLWESKTEVMAMIGKIDASIEAYHERCPDKKITETLFTHHKPHGVVAVIGPFNFPGHLPSGHLVPALLAGNCVIIKGSPHTPRTTQLLLDCLNHLPAGVVQSTDDIDLPKHPGIDGIFFTGSHKVGMSLLTQPEKIVALEMGGNNPLVVWDDVADLEAAAYQTIHSAYITAGQRCSCARRLIVPEGRFADEFLKVLVHMIDSIRVGVHTETPEPFMGRVISRDAVDNLLNTQAILGSEGGNCLVEMRPIEEDSLYLRPGLMDVTGVKKKSDEEVFGPFLRLMRVPTFDAAIEEANNTRYGLSAALFSGSEEKFRHFFHAVRAGVINWNHPTTGASGKAPFGGVGKSGNYHPSGYYAADYCSYPVASMERGSLNLPEALTPGITLLAKT